MEPGRFEDLGGKGLKELGEALFLVWVACGLAGGEGEVAATETAEEVGKDALAEQVQSNRPVVDAGEGELVKGPAGLAGGEDERGRELADGGLGTSGAATERVAVVVAEEGVGGIDTGALETGMCHGAKSG